MKKKNSLQMPDKIFGISSSLIKLFFPLLGLVVFLLTSIGWLIIPKVETIKSLKNSIESTKSQTKLTDEKRSYLLSIDQEQLKKDADYLSSAVLREKNSYLLVEVIKNITNKYGYIINSFSLSIGELKEDDEKSLKVADKNVAQKMPITVELSGPTDKLIDLIKGLENNLPILFIDNLKISKQDTSSILKMIVSSYYVPDSLGKVSDNLTINDLKLTKEESDLLVKISQFENNLTVAGLSDFEGGTFVEYDRTNPF